jgi:hypothetical protein
VGFSVGVGNGVAVGSTVKFGVGVSVGNLRSAPTQEEMIKAKRKIISIRIREVLILRLFLCPPMAIASSLLRIIENCKKFKR